MMTFLDLVNAFVTETGINGGRLFSNVITGENTAEARRIAGYVADADFRIQSIYNDWTFLWRQFGAIISASTNTVQTPNLDDDGFMFRRIDRESLVLSPSLTNAYRPVYQPWKEFSKQWLTGPMVSSNSPQNFTVAPDQSIRLSANLINATTCRYDMWAKPYRMRSSGDVSPIVLAMSTHPLGPNSFSTPAQNAKVVKGYSTSSADNVRDIDGRIIVVRAKIIYAEAEGALEVMQGSLAEYEELLGQLQAWFLPGQDDDMSSETDDMKSIYTP